MHDTIDLSFLARYSCEKIKAGALTIAIDSVSFTLRTNGEIVIASPKSYFQALYYSYRIHEIINSLKNVIMIRDEKTNRLLDIQYKSNIILKKYFDAKNVCCYYNFPEEFINLPAIQDACNQHNIKCNKSTFPALNIWICDPISFHFEVFIKGKINVVGIKKYENIRKVFEVIIYVINMSITDPHKKELFKDIYITFKKPIDILFNDDIFKKTSVIKSQQSNTTNMSFQNFVNQRINVSTLKRK